MKHRKPSGKAKKPRAGSVPAQVDLPDRVWLILVPATFLILVAILFRDFLFSGGMLFGTDTLPMGYAARKAYSDLVVATGSLPLWNPYLLGGVPMVDGLVGGDMFYPTTLLQFIMPVHRALGLKLVIHIFLAAWLCYLYLRSTGVGRPAALVGGVGYGFAPYIISLIYAGHDGKLFVTALLPLGFLALDSLITRARIVDLALFATSIGLMILTAHLQLAFFACLAFGFRFLWKAIEGARAGEMDRVFRAGILFVVAALLGAAIGAVQTYPAYLYTSTWSPRAGGVTYEFATSWSIHWEEAVSLIVPEFVHYLDYYWGENPFKLNCESPGFLIMFLVLAGFFRIAKDRELSFWYWLLGLTLIYALGAETPAFRIIYMVVPKFFRAPSTILFLFSFGAAVIAARVLDSWLCGKGRRSFVFGSSLAGGIVVLLFLMSSGGEGFFRAWGNVVRGGLSERHIGIAVANASEIQTATIVLLLFAGAFVAIVKTTRIGKVPAAYAGIALALLVFASDMRTDADFIKSVDLRNYMREGEAIRVMQQDDELFRVLSMSQDVRGNVFGAFGIEAAGGFFDNKLRSYDELISGEAFRNANLISLLNIKYLLIPAPGMQHPWFSEVVRDGNDILYRNNQVLPRAYLTEQFEVVSDREELLRRMGRDDFDFSRSLFLDDAPRYDPPATGGPANAPVEWVEKGPNRYVMKVRANNRSMLFVSNNWLPHWHAFVDGEPVKLHRANYTFQGVEVPPGEHEVSIRYRSAPFELARTITLGAVAVVLLGGTAAHFRGRKKEEGSSV